MFELYSAVDFGIQSLRHLGESNRATIAKLEELRRFDSATEAIEAFQVPKTVYYKLRSFAEFDLYAKHTRSIDIMPAIGKAAKTKLVSRHGI